MLANIWTDIGVRSDVLLQHAGLFTADTTLSTFVLPPTPTSHVNVLLVRLKPKKEGQYIAKYLKLMFQKKINSNTLTILSLKFFK